MSTPVYFNCQAKVQSKSSPTPSLKSKVQSPKSKLQTPRLDLRWHYNWKGYPTHPTHNFMGTSRSPTSKCYTFLDTSHDPQLRSQLRCKNFANFFATHFSKPRIWKLPNILSTSVIPFWKPLTTPILNPNWNAKFSLYPFPLPLALDPLTPIPFTPYPFT